MSAEQYTTERSSLNKKPEWGKSLVGHHHHHHRQCAGHIPHLQQQNLQQTQQDYAHQQLVGGCLDGASFQPDAGISCAETVYEHRNTNIDACRVQEPCHFDTAAEDTVLCDGADVGAAHTRPASAPKERFGMPEVQDTSTINNQKNSINITAELLHQERGIKDHVICVGKGSVSMSTSIKTPTARRTRNTSISPLTVRPTGTKDRHSKVRTAKGLRDRRVRLSAPTAIQFFDVQDRLGYDQPSKAVDWLIKKARAAIDELAPVEAVIAGDETTDMPAREQKLSKAHHDGLCVKVKDEERSMAVPTVGCVRAESRAKARERARERAKEKCVSSIPSAATSGEAAITSAATTPVQSFVPSTSSNVHLLPEFFLLSGQLCQQFDDPNRPSDLSSLLSQPSSTTLAPYVLPHFFSSPPPSSTSSFIYPGDVPPSFQFSVPPIYNNTPISPRGTLQSIFSNPANSSMQPHMPMPPLNMMMGALQQAHVYGAALNSVRDQDQHDNDEKIRQRSAELGSPDLHQHSRIPMRIHGMELDSRVEETRITPSSMQADFQ